MQTYVDTLRVYSPSVIEQEKESRSTLVHVCPDRRSYCVVPIDRISLLLGYNRASHSAIYKNVEKEETLGRDGGLFSIAYIMEPWRTELETKGVC